MDKKSKFIDYVIVSFRWYLAIYMILYGWDKLQGEQFNSLSNSILEVPLKNISKFRLFWYLFSLDRTFNYCVGLLQIIGAILIIFNRTVLIGTLLLLPILFQILIIDLAYTTEEFGYALPLRIFGMIVCDILILFYYKERMVVVWKVLTDSSGAKVYFKWWAYLLLPIIGFLMDFIIAIINMPLKYLGNLIQDFFK